ncbi:hypothetical protein P7K49_013591 [Saguinus oedipus]|uniref:Uncharacterized protein n=1 Tax=Saguinus oedipus TaxID=9490 RepID=A0ABQ9VGX8_SAGOE|nr:hypothetical protein P7K49_013591 [Saguinus oedipus]
MASAGVEENSPAAAHFMLVNCPAPHTPVPAMFPKAFCPVEVLQDCVLEDIEDEELLENSPAAAHFMLVNCPAPHTPVPAMFPKAFCPVEVLQDCVLEDIEDEELLVLQDCVLEDIEDEELLDCVLEDIEDEEPLEWPVVWSYHRPVVVLQDYIFEDIEEEETLEWPVVWSYHRPVEVLQDCILETIEEEETLNPWLQVPDRCEDLGHGVRNRWFREELGSGKGESPSCPIDATTLLAKGLLAQKCFSTGQSPPALGLGSCSTPK